ncbi:hypothetical protein [Methanobrevibacter sp.]
MLLEIYDINYWKNFFDLIHDSTTIVELKLDQDKCSMSLLNNTHTCFYTIEFMSDFFTEYYVDDAESVLIFVADFYNIIKTATTKDRLTLSTNDNALRIVLEHDENRRIFEIPLAEDFGDTPTPPSIPVKLSFDVILKDLKQPCRDLDKIIKTGRFKINVSDEVMEIVSPSDSMTKYNQRIIIDNTGAASTIVNLQYVNDLQKLNKISDTITFGVGDNVPLLWNMKSYDGFVEVHGMIAPIIEDNE